eukprot:jgi/Hompol1/4691/HPOL_000034-RA
MPRQPLAPQPIPLTQRQRVGSDNDADADDNDDDYELEIEFDADVIKSNYNNNRTNNTGVAHHNEANAALAQLIGASAPLSLSNLLTLSGFVSLLIAPFFQGLAHGLGEGIARILVGRFVGVDPLSALTGRRAAAGASAQSQAAASPQKKKGFLTGMFSSRSSNDRPVAAAAQSSSPSHHSELDISSRSALFSS